MSRRLILRGLGGAVVAAPFLSSVAERLAKAEGAPAPATPKRLIVMFTHYGCLTNRWFPANSHGRLTGDDYVGTTLEVLAPHADKLLLPRGIRAMNEWTPEATMGQGNDPHTQVAGTYFTCMPVTPHSSDPFSFDEAVKFNAKPIGPSLDHVCGKQLSPGGLPLFMRVGNGNDTPASGISYSAAETPFAGFGTPAQALSSLTGLFQPGPLSPDSYQAVRGKSVVDLVQNDLKTLERFDMSQADKQKLAAWKELMHETAELSISSLCTPEVATALGLTEANLQAAEVPPPDGDRLASKITDSLDGADLYSNVAVLAALCDANRVIFLKYPANYTFRALGLNDESDGLSHRLGAAGMTGTCLAGVNEMLLKIDRYYAQKFAHLVGQLDSFDEGDGKLLDNTAAVWFQQTSDGAALNLNNMPIIQAGSCGGYFKTGCAVNVDDGTSDLHRGNSEAACSEEGGTVDISNRATGTPPEFGNAPINKYYCNLMNAIGVKAGEDGFPLPGGTEEVTHYGMYDRTEDFASGGALPAFISNPGGFEELKASS